MLIFVRSWNVLPSNKIDAGRMVVPLGVVYTPLGQQQTPSVQCDPVSCKECRSILNPYWYITLFLLSSGRRSRPADRYGQSS